MPPFSQNEISSTLAQSLRCVRHDNYVSQTTCIDQQHVPPPSEAIVEGRDDSQRQTSTIPIPQIIVVTPPPQNTTPILQVPAPTSTIDNDLPPPYEANYYTASEVNHLLAEIRHEFRTVLAYYNVEFEQIDDDLLDVRNRSLQTDQQILELQVENHRLRKRVGEVVQSLRGLGVLVDEGGGVNREVGGLGVGFGVERGTGSIAGRWRRPFGTDC